MTSWIIALIDLLVFRLLSASKCHSLRKVVVDIDLQEWKIVQSSKGYSWFNILHMKTLAEQLITTEHMLFENEKRSYGVYDGSFYEWSPSDQWSPKITATTWNTSINETYRIENWVTRYRIASNNSCSDSPEELFARHDLLAYQVPAAFCLWPLMWNPATPALRYCAKVRATLCNGTADSTSQKQEIRILLSFGGKTAYDVGSMSRATAHIHEASTIELIESSSRISWFLCKYPGRVIGELLTMILENLVESM